MRSRKQQQKSSAARERFRSVVWKALRQHREIIKAKEEEMDLMRKQLAVATPLQRFRIYTTYALTYEKNHQELVDQSRNTLLQSNATNLKNMEQDVPLIPTVKNISFKQPRLPCKIKTNVTDDVETVEMLEYDTQCSSNTLKADDVTVCETKVGGMKALNLFKERAKERVKVNATLKLKQKMRLLVQERLTVKQIFQKYVESSTLHGFVYTCSDTFAIRRFIWACLMVMGAIYFLFKFKDAIILFLQYPFSTLATLEYVDHLKFPAISFCLINQYKYSRLEQTSLNELYIKNWLPIGKMWKFPGVDIPGDVLINDNIVSSFKMADIFAECDFIRKDTDNPNTKPRRCGTENFTTFFSRSGQLCYTLNSGQRGHPLFGVEEEGTNNGYELVFDLRNDDVVKLFDYTGIQITVHDQAEPAVAGSGFFISPGSRTLVKMDMTETLNLPPPYGTQCGEVPLKYHEQYDQKACILEKETMYVGNACGCREAYMPDNGLPYCSVKQLSDCVFSSKEKMNNKAQRLECPTNCKEIKFKSSVSTSRYLMHPSKSIDTRYVTSQIEGGENKTYLLALKKKYNETQLLKTYTEENLINVIFFYGEMSKAVNIQKAKFTFYNFLGDAGGNFGLMLGASLLTFVEFIDLFIFLLYHQLLRLNKHGDTQQGNEK